MKIDWRPSDNGSIVLRVWPMSSTDSDQQFATWQRVMMRVNEFAAIGGLSRAPDYPSSRPLELISVQLHAAPMYESVFAPHDASLYTPEALGRVIDVFATHVGRLAGAQVLAFDGAGPMRDRGLEPLIQRVPFSWSDERLQFTDGFYVRVLANKAFEEQSAALGLEDAFGRWITAVNLGMFSDFGRDSGTSYIHLDDAPKIDGFEMQFSFGDYRFAEPEGLEGLARALLHFHRSGVELASVELHE